MICIGFVILKANEFISSLKVVSHILFLLDLQKHIPLYSNCYNCVREYYNTFNIIA